MTWVCSVVCVCACPSRAHGLGSGCNATGMCVRGVCVGCLCVRGVSVRGLPVAASRGSTGRPSEWVPTREGPPGRRRGRPRRGSNGCPGPPRAFPPACPRAGALLQCGGYLLGLSSALRSINRSIEAVPGLLLRSDRLGPCNAQGPPSAFPRVPKGWSPAATRGTRSGGCFLRVFSIDHGEPRVSPRIVYI